MKLQKESQRPMLCAIVVDEYKASYDLQVYKHTDRERALTQPCHVINIWHPLILLTRTYNIYQSQPS